MARVITADAPEAEVVPGAVRLAQEAAEALMIKARAQASDLLRNAQHEADALIINARVEAGLQAREEVTQVLLEASTVSSDG
jgi:F0F1-type ATP synthase membrane subunit b/b'